MRRREFITLLGGAAVAWPLSAGAQQPERVRQIGVFMRLSESDPVTKGYLTALSGGLAPLGWSENRNLQFEKRLTGGDDAATNAAAADLVRCESGAPRRQHHWIHQLRILDGR
jgi:putative ABC transport system substrate-binding protein